MSKVIDAAIPAATSTAPEPAQAPVSTTPTDIPFAEQQKSWTREEMAEWRMSGAEPAKKSKPAPAEAPAATTEKIPEQSVPEKGKTEAAPEPAEEDQELPEGDTVEARRARNRMFAKLRHDRATFKAKAELLEQQSKEKPARTTESTTAPAAKPATTPESAKKFREPNDTETLGEYLAARDDFNRNQWISESKAERETEREQETVKQREARVVSEFTERRNAFLKKGEAESTEDHRLRALQYATASRWFTGQTEAHNALHVEEAILESEHGHRLMLHYHGHQDEFAALLKQSPSKALLAIGEVSATFKQKPPELKPKTRTSAPDPGDRVDSSTSASSDPLKAAYEKYDRTKDPKDLEVAMKLENEKEIARLTAK